jgi:sec-independent protein translocase protein TatB
MFDIGITEIMVIAVVALVVIGPERLPRVARTIGTLLGRAQRYVNDVKAEVNREMELEELRKLQTQMQDAARDIQQTVSTAGADVRSAVQDVEKSLTQTMQPIADSVNAPTTSAPTESVPLTEVTPLSGPPPPPHLAAPDNPAAAAPSSSGQAESPPATAPAPAQAALFPEHTVR